MIEILFFSYRDNWLSQNHLSIVWSSSLICSVLSDIKFHVYVGRFLGFLSCFIGLIDYSWAILSFKTKTALMHFDIYQGWFPSLSFFFKCTLKKCTFLQRYTPHLISWIRWGVYLPLLFSGSLCKIITLISWMFGRTCL